MTVRPKKLVMFGAGNIGRSFIGQLFSEAGYETVFVDIDPVILDELNKKGFYRVVVKQNDIPDREITVQGVRGINGTDIDAVAGEIIDASIIATAVGKGAIPHVLPVVAEGIRRRISAGNGAIDIIIAENVRDAAAWYRRELFPALDTGQVPDDLVGLVETSIGKMVPIMTKRDRQIDPLQVFAENYNTLIVDRKGFRNGVPPLPGLQAVDNIQAYVDRKLFIHNLGHAAAAYFGFATHPERRYIYEHMHDEATAGAVRDCMLESAAALNREYPEDLATDALERHIDDLITRFGNHELKDTVHRVGRDLRRKLGRDDRLVGAMLLANRHELPFGKIADAASAAFSFKALGEDGCLFSSDEEFFSDLSCRRSGWILDQVCGLAKSRGTGEERVRRELSSRLGNEIGDIYG